MQFCRDSSILIHELLKALLTGIILYAWTGRFVFRYRHSRAIRMSDLKIPGILIFL